MEKHEVRHIEGLMKSLCNDLGGNPYALNRLEELLLGCIDLARTGKAWKATSIAIEASSYMARRATTDHVGASPKEKPWWVQPRVDLNYRPVATTEQMQAAADAAMKNPPAVFECTGCGKHATSTDGHPPLGWVANAEVDGEIYKRLCATCFGVGIPTDCDYCGATDPGSKDSGWWRFTVKNSITGKYEPRVSCDNCYDSVKDAEDEEP